MFSGISAIKKVNRFPVDRYYAEMAACIHDLEENRDRSLVYDLVDRVLIGLKGIDPAGFLITASTKAGIDTILDSCKSGNDSFHNGLPPSIADYIKDKLALKGETLNISAACASSTVAIAKGAALIESGRCDSVLV